MQRAVRLSHLCPSPFKHVGHDALLVVILPASGKRWRSRVAQPACEPCLTLALPLSLYCFINGLTPSSLWLPAARMYIESPKTRRRPWPLLPRFCSLRIVEQPYSSWLPSAASRGNIVRPSEGMERIACRAKRWRPDLFTSSTIS